MMLYQTLERVNARAAVRYAENSSKIEEIKSDDDHYDIKEEFRKINDLLSRVHEGYHYLVKAHPFKKGFDFSSAGLNKAIKRVTSTKTLQSIKRLAHQLQQRGIITIADYDRIFETASRLAPLLNVMPAGHPSASKLYTPLSSFSSRWRYTLLYLSFL